jgi:peptide/nickel transport system substrate-binding protein
MTFERFEDYYQQPENGFSTDKRPNFTTLELLLVPEEATRVAALRAGDADIAPITMGSKNQVEAGDGRVVFGEEAAYFRVVQMGCMNPQFPCHDIRVRQALNLAFNKELMRDQLYGGPEVMQVKGWGSISPSTIGYSPELDPYPYDPDKARQLLAEAGYKTPTNPDGKDFGKLIINTYVSPSLPLMPESAQLGAEFWKRELGIDAEVRVGDQSALKKSCRLTEDCYGQILWRDNETKVDGVGSLRSVYGYRPDRFDVVHDDQELFDMVKDALTVFEPVEREKVLNSTYRRIRDEYYHIALGYVNLPWGVGPRVLTWDPYPLAFYPSAIHTITLK